MSENVAAESVGEDPVSHWQSRLTVNVVSDRILFDSYNIPGEINQYLQWVIDVLFFCDRQVTKYVSWDDLLLLWYRIGFC